MANSVYIKLISSEIGTCSLEEHFLELPRFFFLLLNHSVVSDSATAWAAAPQASLSFIVSWGLLKLMSIESVKPSNHLIVCCLFLLLSSIFPSIRVFSNELALHTFFFCIV